MPAKDFMVVCRPKNSDLSVVRPRELECAMRAALKLTSVTAAEEDLVRVNETNNMMTPPCRQQSSEDKSQDGKEEQRSRPREQSSSGARGGNKSRDRSGSFPPLPGAGCGKVGGRGSSHKRSANSTNDTTKKGERGYGSGESGVGQEAAAGKRVAETSTADTPQLLVKVTSLKTDVTILADRVGKLEDRQDRLEARVGRIEARLDKIKERFHTFTNEFPAFKTQAHKAALGLSNNPSTERLMRLGVNTTLEELREAHLLMQLDRLSKTKSGRDILKRIGIGVEAPAGDMKTQMRWELHKILYIEPLPKNVHPIHHEEGKKARATALHAEYEKYNGAVYVDVAVY
ncbi:hypothetical protein HPB49_024221 [Dermacentor silvarum]|uniref:Uncharacterized protein n=1 Tax=Dermacentor silvarum TaxID=543639 RepID=A0ACB8D0Z3_DERSI|nr:hypothetical protein HPB49_024221 [Dermacentor silvarum]